MAISKIRNNMLEEASEYGKTLLATADQPTLENTFTTIPPSTTYGKTVLVQPDKDALQVDLEVENQKNKNVIINGDFDIWQRGVTQTTSGFDSDDRWSNQNSTTTKVHNQVAFALGQADVPNNPKNYSSTVVTSVAGVSNYCVKQQKIEDVIKLSGQIVTLSFWAKADAPKNIATEYAQDFGTGGSPSALISGLSVVTHALTTAWQKFTVTTTIPSVTGKTLGTDGNDHLRLYFWLDAGSNFDSRTNTLGQQSGTFDIAQVQLERGSIPTNFENRPIGDELSLCQRYYYQVSNLNYMTIETSNTGSRQVTYIHPMMRTIPTITSSITNANSPTTTPTVDSTTIACVGVPNGAAISSVDTFTADSEL